MDFPAAIPASVAALLGAWLVLGVCVYANLLRAVATGSGKVNAREFGLPDLFFGSVFFLWFLALIVGHFTTSGPTRPITEAGLIQTGVLFAAIIAVIAGFLQYRRIGPVRIFGLRSVGPVKVLAVAVGLLLAAYPLILCAGVVMLRVIGTKAEPQEVVTFIADSAKNSQSSALFLAVGLGVLCAPVAEELIFRGYLYGVLKKYLGMTAAAFLCSALFAAMHLNLASLPALFILALCLTLAYEITGSLLVTMCMHALFNLTSIVALLHAATP